MADSVIESSCPPVCVCVCLRHRVQFFFRPLIGPQVTWSVPGISLVLLPPSPLLGATSSSFRKKHCEIAKRCLKTSHRLSRCQVVPNKKRLSEFFFFCLEFEFGHNFSCRVLSQFKLLNLVTVWVLNFFKLWVEFSLNSCFSVVLPQKACELSLRQLEKYSPS